MQDDIFQAPSFLWSRTARENNGRFRKAPPHTCDLVIIGAGGTGLAAALAAAEQGQSVILLEKEAEPGGIFAHNGGIVLDGFEGDILEIKKRQGEDAARDMLAISHNGVNTVKSLSRKVCGNNFSHTGFITAFSNAEQRRAQEMRVAEMCRLLPEAYAPQQFRWLRPDDIGSPYFNQGGVYSPHGGVLDSARFIYAMACAVAKFPHASICTRKTALALEAAPDHGVRVHYREGGQFGEIQARRAILTGDAWKLIPGFPAPQCATTGMIATSWLPEALAARIRQSVFRHVPVQGPQIIGPDYYRREVTAAGVRLLFGGSGRVGANEEQETLKDVIAGLYRVFPRIGRLLDSGKMHIAQGWARRQILSRHDLPVVAGYDPAQASLFNLPPLPAQNGTKLIPHVPVLYIGELGGHGISFACDLGTRAGRMQPRDYTILETCSRERPEKSLTLRQLQKRAAAERRQIIGDHSERTDNESLARRESLLRFKP